MNLRRYSKAYMELMDLPDEMIGKCLERLPMLDLMAAAAVCRRLNHCALGTPTDASMAGGRTTQGGGGSTAVSGGGATAAHVVGAPCAGHDPDGRLGGVDWAGGLLCTSTRPTLNQRPPPLHNLCVCMSMHHTDSLCSVLDRVLVLDDPPVHAPEIRSCSDLSRVLDVKDPAVW